MACLFVLFFACGIWATVSQAAIPRNEVPPTETCTEYKAVLEGSVVEAVAVFFSEYPLPDRPPFTPSRVRPLNALNLYKDYYGEGASPTAFISVVLSLLHSDPGGPNIVPPVDKVEMRHRIYMHAKQQNFGAARESFGHLLYHDMSELDGKNWLPFRCIEEKDLERADGIISMEISRLRREIGERNFRKFFSLDGGTSLAFVIDDTGSMAEEIDAVRRRINLLIDQQVGSLDQPQHFVLVPFNDPKVGPITSTNDPNKIKEAIERVYAHGGGDLPELSMKGINLALEKALPGSTIYVITDAEAKDAELQDQIIAIANMKQIKLTFLLTERMTSWLCAVFVSARRLAACRDPSLKLGLELYEHLANSTGGETLIVRRSSIFQATELVHISLKHGLVDLEKRTLYADDNIEFFVDSSIKELYVYASGSCDNVRLRTGGSPVRFEHSMNVGHLFVGSINITTYGRYRLTVATNNQCGITVKSKSSKGFFYTVTRELGNETDTQYLDVIRDNPTLKDKVVVLVDLFGFQNDDSVRTIFFIDERTGETVQTYRVKDGLKRHFRVVLESFSGRKLLVYIGGVDSSGFQFRRLASHSIQSVEVDIDCSGVNNGIVRAGTPTQVPVVLRNLGNESQYYTVGASDDKKFITSVSQARILVSPDQEARFNIRLRIPVDTKIGTQSRVTITVKDQAGNLVYKQCQLTVAPKQSPEIEYYRVTSNINTRFAETIIQSKYVNDGWSPREAKFYIVVPKNGFITEFTMTVGGTTYPAEIKPLNEAKTFYDIGKREGLTLGIVSPSQEESVFQTSVTLKGDEDVIFQIKYQEQLIRSRGRYQHQVHVQPGQIAGSLTIEINIWESLAITGLRVLNFETEQSVLPEGVELKGVTATTSSNSAKVRYSPTDEQQSLLSPLGMNGKFSIEYDLIRRKDKISELVAFDTNFLHFFVPEYDTMRKRVVFLLDNSGSMFGKRLNQLKQAMVRILDTLKAEDSFAIIFFSSKVQTWDPHPGDDTRSVMVKASPDNIASAKTFISSISAQGGTDLLNGLEIALNVLEGYVEDEDITPHFSTDFILLLSDGPASEGETTPSAIISTITSLNKLKFGIHAIGFGSTADSPSLSRLASRNNGKFTEIYNILIASKQIEDFFELLANPMLRDIRIRYPSRRLIPTTKLNFKQYQLGSEIVVAGRFANATQCLSSEETENDTNAEEVDVTFTAKTDGDDVFVEETLYPKCDDNDDELQELIERQEKYLKLIETLKELDETNNETRIGELKDEIDTIVTENGFVVRDHTALVVSKPGDIKEIDESIILELEEESQRLTESSTTPAPTRLPTTPSTIPGDVVTPAFGRITVSTITPFTASRPRLEFFGDPHFVIDIEQQITLCFNWDGTEGQTINLLHDPLKGITVNGRLVTSKSPSDSVRSLRTYVNKVGIFIQNENTSIVVTSKKVVLRVAGKGSLTLPFGKYGSRKRKGISLKVKPLTKFKSTLFIHIGKKTIFRVISRINSKNEFVKDHLDFAVIRGDDLSDSAVGVLGQFSRFKSAEKVPASIEFRADGKTALLWYRHNPIEVAYHVLRDYNSDREVECWYMADKKQLWENDEDVFVVKGILDPPETIQLDHR